jgi:hypothetical protein
MQTAMTLPFGTAQDARVPELDGSGATGAVLGACIVLCSASRVLTRTFPVFLVRIPGWFFRRSDGAPRPSTAASSWLAREAGCRHEDADRSRIRYSQY